MGRKNIDNDIKILYANKTLKWCKNYFGINERKRTKLVIDYSKRKRMIKNHIVFGNYCFWRNKITIYLPNCLTIHDVISTVIHEYTHYLQSRNRYLDFQYYYYYSTNPYEREAKRNEEKYTNMCLKEIKSRF